MSWRFVFVLLYKLMRLFVFFFYRHSPSSSSAICISRSRRVDHQKLAAKDLQWGEASVTRNVRCRLNPGSSQSCMD